VEVNKGFQRNNMFNPGQARNIVGGSLILSLLMSGAGISTLILMGIWIGSVQGTISAGGYL
jgi:hypothetical protein